MENYRNRGNKAGTLETVFGIFIVLWFCIVYYGGMVSPKGHFKDGGYFCCCAYAFRLLGFNFIRMVPTNS